ncbi:MAG: flagellar biosynthesis protein FlhB [Ideonella sp.]|jgi:flagellar biosynthetic protein FlhB|nr:flagellar biosynthesis protein FlhB [Ideonella sp.]
MAAPQDDAQDRHLPATPRKIQKAREQGQVERSRDLGHAVAIGLGGLLLAFFAPQVLGFVRDLLVEGLRFDAAAVTEADAMTQRLGRVVQGFLWIVLPLGALMMIAGVLAALMLGGWNWTLKPLEPKFEKLDPIAGLKRLFSKFQLTETLKACLLAVLLGTIGAVWLRSHLEDFTSLLGLPLPAALSAAGQTLLAGLGFLMIVLVASAVIDMPLQRKLHADQLKMSWQEMKQEYKELEGNAEVKSKQRVRMREAVNRRMLAAVPDADLVVMNPTHFAVALKYDEATMAAPRVVAKGADLMAFRIRDAATGAQVPVLQAPVLARALYAHAELDREIPAALFAAVAQVLAYVYQLRAALAGQAAAPGELPDLPVPAELDPQSATARPPSTRDLDD